MYVQGRGSSDGDSNVRIRKKKKRRRRPCTYEDKVAIEVRTFIVKLYERTSPSEGMLNKEACRPNFSGILTIYHLPWMKRYCLLSDRLDKPLMVLASNCLVESNWSRSAPLQQRKVSWGLRFVSFVMHSTERAFCLRLSPHAFLFCSSYATHLRQEW